MYFKVEALCPVILAKAANHVKDFMVCITLRTSEC